MKRERTPAQRETLRRATEARAEIHRSWIADFELIGGLALPRADAAARLRKSERTVQRWRKTLRAVA